MYKQRRLITTSSSTVTFLYKVGQKTGEVSQLLAYSLLFSHLSFIPYVHAGPAGGSVVGGSGSINQSGLNTTINQSTGSMAINWDSYNLSSTERVQYIQPDSSSISLNRILSHSGSEIHGRIDANGTVILVNPNGVFFGPNSQINVGGLIASGLDISPNDFMNGDYIFNEVLGTDGAVINSGIINASLGGNVALIGKQVKNEGVINAKLGAVNMAAGKQAVLTFDNQGLLGVKISKEILQNELGIDPAVINSGEINAEGGRVLLTASVSRDVFSQAVNTGELEQATSVLMNADGSFSLGAGADVLNSGGINVSASGDMVNAGNVVVIGENVTHTGVITADTSSGSATATAGNIELHANTTVELKGDAKISARAETSGTGGKVKVLGTNVGLLDNSVIDVSGANGGGETLIGGDRQGLNANIRNADFLYMSENAKVFADGLNNGNGGRIITFANDTGRFYGGLFARGGSEGGNGGFIETSGKKGFEVLNAPDVSARVGEGGLWLIDPYDITIQGTGDATTYNTATSPPGTFYTSIASALPSTIDVGVIQTALGLGDVSIITDPFGGGGESGLITVAAVINYNGTGTKTLTLDSAGGISFTALGGISDGTPGGDSLNVNLFAVGSVLLNTGVEIDTNGGNFTVGDANAFPVNSTPTSFIASGTASIDTSGRANTAAGNISITTSGNIEVSTLTAMGGAADNQTVGRDGGGITLDTSSGNGSIIVTGIIDASGSNGDYQNNFGGQDGGNGGSVFINTSTGSSVSLNQIITGGGNADGDGNEAANGGNAGSINVTSNAITLNNNLSATAGNRAGSGTDGTDGVVTASLTGTNAQAIINYAANFSSKVTIDGVSALTNATLTGSNRANTWNITGPDSGNLNGTNRVAFTNISNLTGNADTDDFVLSGTGSLSGSIDGKVGVNTLTGRDDNTIWNITTPDAGDSTHIGSFTGIGTIDGGSAKDDFIISGTGSVSVEIDGNGGTTDSLTANNNATNTWNISTATSGDVNDVALYSGIEELIGGSNNDNFILSNTSPVASIDGMGGTNTITGRNADTTWEITAANEGNTDEVTSFTNIGNLNGNSSDDDFVLLGTGSLTGSIDGVAGTNTLTGRDSTTNTWNITGIDSGKVTNIDGTFSNIKDVIGGAGDDDFVLSLIGRLSGSINGNGGTNSLTGRSDTANAWNIDGVDQGKVDNISGGFVYIQRLIGGALNDTFDLSASSSEITVSIDGGGGTANVLTGRDSGTTWQITTANAGNSDDVASFTNINSINGGSLADDFVLSGTGSLSGSIDGQGGTNSLQGRDNTLNTWNIFAADKGTVTNITGTFTNIEDLVGGAGTDNFVLSVNGTVNSIDGNGGNNSLTARDNATNDWVIDALDSGNVNNVADFNDIQNLIGGAFVDNFELSGTGSVSSIDGKGGNNTLQGRDTDTTWNITSPNSGSTDHVTTFSNIAKVTGGSLDDRFVLGSTGALAGSVNGGGGTNYLTANNASNIWQVDSRNAGTLSGINGFKDIQNITGGALDDVITFTTTSSWIDGLIDGGSGIDELNIAALTSDITVKLGTTVDVNIINVDNVETITANAARENTIIAEDKSNTWVIDSEISGTIQDTIGAIPETTVRFENFKRMIGGTGADIFRLTGGGVPLLIDGGDGYDSVDYSLLLNETIQIGTAFGSVDRAEQVIGNNTLTLAAENGIDNTWSITGVNSGSVNNANMTNSISFVDFMLLQGGDLGDEFNVNGGSANIKAGAGADILNITLTGTEVGTIVFDGGSLGSGNTVNLLGGVVGYTGSFNSNVTGADDDQFVYTNAGYVFDVTYINTESVLDNLTANTLTVNGTANTDVIDLGTGTFMVNALRAVNYTQAKKTNLIIDGQALNDEINILGDISISNRVTLIAETINNSTASTITATELAISNATNAGDGTDRLHTDVNDLLVSNSGLVYIRDNNLINITQFDNTLLLDVNNLTGDITDGATLASSGELKLTANSGNIVLDNNNQLSGLLSLVASGDVTLTNTIDTNLALVSAQNLTVTSTGQLTDSGVITAIGDTTLTSASDIALDSANNLNNLTVTNAANVVINDINNLNIVAIDATGTVDVTANNLSLDRINAANVKLDAGSGQITDANMGDRNITANSIVMRANSGIGSGDAIETSTAELDVINNGAGGGLVEILNTGNVLLTNLVNTGDINFRNSSNVTINNVNAGYTTGTFQLDVVNGSVFGVDRGSISYLTVADITADTAIITVNGEFGTFERPIVLNLNSEFFLASSVSSKYFLNGPPPRNNDTSDLQISILDSINSVSGQRLIEIDSIADIDPAIFTELHNYNKEDISIRMPRDQMFEDDLENLSRL